MIGRIGLWYLISLLHDVMIIPKDVGEFDTLTLCNVLNLTKDQLMEKWMDMKNPKKIRVILHILHKN